MNRVVVYFTILFFLATFFVIGRKLEQTDEQNLVFIPEEKEEFRAIYVSYIELEKYFKGKEKEEGKKNVISMVENMKKAGFNQILLQVRSFSDAIYPSVLFPYSLKIVENEKDKYSFDLLSYFIEIAHKNGMFVHAWINPYRIRTSVDISTITSSNPAFPYLNTRVVQVIDNKGIYYNPARDETTKLVVDGIKEIIDNYDIDGIHMDDYFYPSDDIDLVEYQEYIDGGGTLSLSFFRYSIINNLISKIYKVIKEKDSSILFGIAPDGNIENNKDKHFLDIETLLRENCYIDYVMPQVYYGFFNETKPFYETVSFWNSLIKNDSISIIPALAFYKSGLEDEYAKSGKNEWIEYSDIIMRQVLMSRNLSFYKGFSLFRYDSLFGDNLNENKVIEFNNLKSIL